MKRPLIISIIVLAVILAGVFVYFYFATSPTAIVVAPNGDSGGGLPVAGQATLPGGGTSAGTFGGVPSQSTGSAVAVSARLVKISSGPVVLGESVNLVKAGDATSSPDIAVRYLERQSGNVFEYLTREHSVTRINNKTLPGIESADWLPDGSAAFVRYLSGADSSTINTYMLSATSSDGFFLPQNLSDITVSASKILSLTSGISGSVASLSNKDGTHTSSVFQTPLTSLRVSFVGNKKYLALSKPSATLPGYAFVVGADGYLSRIFGPKNGLVALASHSGQKVLVSYMQNNSFAMAVVDVADGKTLQLPVATIADKCAWTPDDTAIYCGVPLNAPTSATYPDDWYQGAVSFSDRIWKIDVAGRYAQMILDFSQADQGFLDAEALVTDTTSFVLVFVNKNDGSLWSYSPWGCCG